MPRFLIGNYGSCQHLVNRRGPIFLLRLVASFLGFGFLLAAAISVELNLSPSSYKVQALLVVPTMWYSRIPSVYAAAVPPHTNRF